MSNGELQLTLHTRFVYRKVEKVLQFFLSNSVLGIAKATSSPRVLCLGRGKGKEGRDVQQAIIYARKCINKPAAKMSKYKRAACMSVTVCVCRKSEMKTQHFPAARKYLPYELGHNNSKQHEARSNCNCNSCTFVN